MDALLEQFAADPLGRLALHYAAQFGVANCYLFLLVAARLSGMLVLAPWFTTNSVPVLVRGVLVVLLSCIIAPTLSGRQVVENDITLVSHNSQTPFVLPATPIDLICAIGSEVGFGSLMGIAVMAVFGGLQLAGGLLDRHSGLGLATLLNPEMPSDETACGSLAHWMGIVALLLIEPIGGQGLLLQTLLRSFQAVPVGSAVWSTSLLELLNGLAQQSLLLGLRIAMPLVAAMTLVDVALAFASRGVSHLGSSLMVARTAVGLFVLALTVTAIPEAIATTMISMSQIFSF